MKRVNLRHMLALVYNEQIKIYSRTRTWIMLFLLATAVVATGIILRNVAGTYLNHVLIFMEYVQMLTSLAFIFSIVVAGDSVASEFSWGTIKLLLIRPASRTKIWLSKYVSALLFMAVLLIVMVIVSYFVGLLLFGAGGVVRPDLTFLSILQGYGLSAIDIAMSMTLAFMISSVFRSGSLAIGLSIFFMFTASSLVIALRQFGFDWTRYLLFANTDLSAYFAGTKPFMPGMTLGFSVLVLVAHWIGFMLISWVCFTRRDVAGN